MQNNPYDIRSSEVAWSCPWWKVRHDAVTVNGKDGDYFYVDNSPSIVVVPITTEGKIVMIRQYRHPVRDWCWEVPAGKIEKGQSPEDAVRAELQEEVGGEAERIERIASFYNTNGSSNEQSLVFLATGVTLSNPTRHFMEVMELHQKSVQETFALARSGEVTDSVSALALFLCEDKIKSL